MLYLFHNYGKTNAGSVEEKLAPQRNTRAPGAANVPTLSRDIPETHNADTSDDSDEGEEDETGELGSDSLGHQVHATIEAIKRKDARVYDPTAKFYSEPSASRTYGNELGVPINKPFHLKDYQRELLLQSDPATHRHHETFSQRQEALRAEISKEIHEASTAAIGPPETGNDSGDPFWTATTPARDIQQGSTVQQPLTREEVDAAGRNPDEFLSKYLISRAWIPSASSKPEVFLSDDEDHEQKAEEFEEAYNLRFEDPEKTNRKLALHSRAAAAIKSVRQDATGKRKRAREDEKAGKSARRLLEEQEHARLRDLKLDEINKRVAQIQAAAGSQGAHFSTEEWFNFLTTDWEDEQWQSFMRDKFGERYYDTVEEQDSAASNDETSRRLRKPRWQEDIDVSDLLEDPSSLKEHSRGAQSQPDRGPRRQDLEKAVERRLKLDIPIKFSEKETPFRYRETSPTTFGLTAPDILLASDSQLNQYVGLKKLAAFRDSASKRRDKKRLGKKARLRQWRRDTFGPDVSTA